MKNTAGETVQTESECTTIGSTKRNLRECVLV